MRKLATGGCIPIMQHIQQYTRSMLRNNYTHDKLAFNFKDIQVVTIDFYRYNGALHQFIDSEF